MLSPSPPALPGEEEQIIIRLLGHNCGREMLSGLSHLTRQAVQRGVLRFIFKQHTSLLSLRMSSASRVRAQFVFPDDQLTPSEQLYSHYLSRASWWGGLIVLLQTSPESPDIFRSEYNTVDKVFLARFFKIVFSHLFFGG